MIYIHILLLFYGVAMEQDLSKKTKISRNLPKKKRKKIRNLWRNSAKLANLT